VLVQLMTTVSGMDNVPRLTTYSTVTTMAQPSRSTLPLPALL